jgi:CHASE3 domain sensor protein
MKFFAPDIARDIDWSKAPIFMDKELSQVMKGAKTGKRFVDKLVQVFKRSGEEHLVLFHVEVQGQKQSILVIGVIVIGIVIGVRVKLSYNLKLGTF